MKVNGIMRIELMGIEKASFLKIVSKYIKIGKPLYSFIQKLISWLHKAFNIDNESKWNNENRVNGIEKASFLKNSV